jgi:hypothetical protein
MAHWVYTLATVSGPAAFVVWQLARVLLLTVGGLTRNPRVSKQCERMLILTRWDANKILKAQADAHGQAESPPTQADSAGTGTSSTASAIEVVPDQHAHAS